ncbi:MAG TPA: HesA/MoeB/ThiF family protein [Candidatus Binataceae bacterium]|nr:HesA/MoeB/ThiF family protein [Candidatus Binataceae bacterium]
MEKQAILIVGMGGLGVPAACALARGGARRIGLVDPDPVELSNLARQVIYGAASLGRLKVEAAAARLREDYPTLEVETCPVALNCSNAADLIARYDFVIDATDDPAAKFLINDTCLALGRPFVYAGVLGMTGQAMTVLPGSTACLRCLFEEAPEPGEIASCREAGIIGPVAAVIGEIEAAEALRWLGGGVPELAGKILTYDGTARGRIRVLEVNPRAGCACGAARRAKNAAALAREPNQSRNQ